MSKWNRKLNQFLKKYTTPFTFAAGILTVLGYLAERVTNMRTATIICYLVATVLAGLPIFFRAITGLRMKAIGIEVLVSIAVFGALFIGEYSEAAIVTFLFQFGTYLEQRTLQKTRSAIRMLTEMVPATAWRLESQTAEPEEIDADEVKEDTLLLVKTGGKVAVDGIIEFGEGYLNEASINGESVPIHKVVGDQVYAGTILDSGILQMRATRVGEDTTFSKIIALVEEAQDAKSPVERFIDRFAKWYTPAVVVIAALVLLITRNLDTAITVLVLACPGALVIGAPVANVAGIGRGAKDSVLLKGGDSVTTFAKVDTFLFDKTGTLTTGHPDVTNVYSYTEDIPGAMKLAAALESTSDHPLAKAIVNYVKKRDVTVEKAVASETLKGFGVRADIDGNVVIAGSKRMMTEQGITLTKEQQRDLQEAQRNLVHFSDDGISGVTMERPGFVAMIQELEEGHAAAVFVKDMSRLGRNYIEVGKLTEEFLPDHDIRLVAVSDNVDTAEGENELTPIRNLFNEWYARDISKKRRISNKIKGNAGEPMGQPPYGYIKDPDNSKRWIVDEEAAIVVRRIYQMTLDGSGPEQIAAALEKDSILTPISYWQTRGVNRPGKHKDAPPTKWNSSTITKILSLQEYCGDVLNFKTYSKSYKNKKRIENDRDNWVIFKDVHDPVIDRASWEKVQQKRGKIRKRKTNEGETNMFSGLLVCADCGHNLHYHFNQGNPDIKYFNCSNYKGNRGTCTSTHYIRVDFLEQVVLGEIHRLTKFASKYEDEFVKAVMGHSQQTVELERQKKQKGYNALLARDKEIDRLFDRMYEDNVAGKISDERFSKMTKQYEDEQSGLAGRIKTLRAELDKESRQSVGTDMFIATVRKYTRARKLTPRMLNELIDHIEVHQAEKVNGVYVQKLTIHYNCIGSIEIPDVSSLQEPDVLIQTRKGVAVSYSQAQMAG